MSLLSKFQVKSVKEESKKHEFISLSIPSLGMRGGKHKETRWSYLITDTNGRKYRIGCIGTLKPLNISGLTEARCLVSKNFNVDYPDTIEWSQVINGYFFTPLQFKKEIERRISFEEKRMKASNELHEQEIARLKSL